MSVLVSLLCWLSTLPGPPGFLFEGNAFFSAYPIDRTLCPQIDTKRDSIFELFTIKNPAQPQILTKGNDKALFNSFFNFSNPTVIYFHGFLESDVYGSANITKNAYMTSKNVNFITVNSQRLVAGPWYPTAASNVRPIGVYTASFIDYLVSRGLRLQSLHLIGHSLGGQIAGATGRNLKSGKAARITALDPALPLFTNQSKNEVLQKTDAEFVDVIHTDGGKFGVLDPLGDVDFYPNGGVANQPGCTFKEIQQRNPNSLLELIFCSHWRSVLFYAESIRNPNSFSSLSCSSYKSYKSGECNNKTQVNMGIAVARSARGNYYLTTNKDSPFSIND